jgi:hypothetical protein
MKRNTSDQSPHQFGRRRRVLSLLLAVVGTTTCIGGVLGLFNSASSDGGAQMAQIKTPVISAPPLPLASTHAPEKPV